MRVTIVTTWFPTHRSPGLGVFVARHAASMAAAGHDIRVVHLASASVDDGVRHDRVMGLPVVRLPMSLSRPHEVLAARQELTALTHGSDVVHTHAVSTLLPYALGRPHQPWLHTEHWSGIAQRGAELGSLAQAGAQVVLRLERRPDVVTTVSDQLATDLRAYRPEGEILTVPNEVTMPEEPAPRRSVELGRDTLRIVGIGGLIERKRPDLAVEAVAALAQQGVPARLTWVGGGPLADRCTDLATDLGVDLELTGQLPGDQVQQVLADSDLFLVPTLAETFFLGAAEAVAAGRPVVTSDRGAHTSFLDPSVCEIVPQDDPAAWARAVVDVMGRCTDLTARDIQDRLPRAFSPSQVARSYGRAYEAAIAQYSTSY